MEFSSIPDKFGAHVVQLLLTNPLDDCGVHTIPQSFPKLINRLDQVDSLPTLQQLVNYLQTKSLLELVWTELNDAKKKIN